MRTDLLRAGVLLAVIGSLGCGDYSNLDLLFLNALPSREDIKSNLPEDASRPLRTPEGAVTQLRSALAPETPTLGLTSKAYEDTKAAAAFFDLVGVFFFNLVQEVEKYPPSVKTEDLRQWGPFVAQDHPDFQIEVVIDRLSDPDGVPAYDYRFEFRRTTDTNPVWTPFLTGHFRVLAGEDEGEGHVVFDSRALAVSGLSDDPGLRQLDSVVIDYRNAGFPKSVHMTFRSMLKEFNYSHAEYEGGSGALAFQFDEPADTVEVRSEWNGDGEGRADFAASNFFGPLGTGAQCWDDHFLLRYHQSDFSDPRLLGSESACATDLPAPLP